MIDFINIVVKGMIVGVANIIPGLSGGTMAFVLGIYKQLTEAIGYFLIRPEKRKEYIFFLAKFGIGVIIGFLAFAKLISILLGIDIPENTPLPFSYVPTFGFFLGLIAGSLIVLIKLQSDTKFTWNRLILGIFGAILLFGLASLKELDITISETPVLIKDFGIFKIVLIPFSRMIWLTIIGMLAAFTMVIPGISGSALLVALGEYGPILNYVSERSLTPIAFIGLGIIIGLILSTLLMTKLLEKRAGATFYFILGLIIASCLQIIMYMIEAEAGISAWLITIPTTVLGYFLALQSAKLQPKSEN